MPEIDWRSHSSARAIETTGVGRRPLGQRSATLPHDRWALRLLGCRVTVRHEANHKGRRTSGPPSLHADIRSCGTCTIRPQDPPVRHLPPPVRKGRRGMRGESGPLGRMVGPERANGDGARHWYHRNVTAGGLLAIESSCGFLQAATEGPAANHPASEHSCSGRAGLKAALPPGWTRLPYASATVRGLEWTRRQVVTPQACHSDLPDGSFHLLRGVTHRSILPLDGRNASGGATPPSAGTGIGRSPRGPSLRNGLALPRATPETRRTLQSSVA